MTEEDLNESQFQTLNLMKIFRKKTEKGKLLNISTNDSYLLQSPSELIENSSVIERIYFTGRSPWDESGEAQLFYTIPFDSTLTDPISSICFPHEAIVKKKKINSNSEFILNVIDSPNNDELEFFCLYLPSRIEAPYFYCCKFKGNPFTMPTLSHELNLEDIFDLCQSNLIPISDMCISIQSKFPNHELYYNLLKWIIQCEKIGKFPLTNFIDIYLQKLDYFTSLQDETLIDSPENIWPNKHRLALSTLMGIIIKKPIPDIGYYFNIDIPPFPKFSWFRSNNFNKIDLLFSLNNLEKLISKINIKTYLQILTSLLLEKTILVYSKNINILTSIITTFHYLIKPLNWVSATIPILPDKLIDLLDSPSPTLIGIDWIPNDISDNIVFFDVENSILYNPPNYLTPFNNILMDRLNEYWNNLNIESLKWILNLTNFSIKELIAPIKVSINTDFSQTDNTGSRFLLELYLKNFLQEFRPFILKFSQTQLLQFHIELECKKCSERHEL